MPFQRIKAFRLYRQVAAQIAGLIESGELKAGQRLPSERDLCAKLSVSRPTIREAMVALEIEGLVDVRTGSGVYVSRNLSSQNFRLEKIENAGASPLDLINARLLIECSIVSEATARAGPGHLERLEQSISDMTLASSGEAFQKADRAFHVIIAEATENSVLVSIVNSLWEEMASPIFERISSISGLAGEHKPPAIAEHRVILDAMQGHDAARAAAAMSTHLSNVRAFLQRDWKEPLLQTGDLEAAE